MIFSSIFGVICVSGKCIGLQQWEQDLINRTRVEANFEMAVKFKNLLGIDVVVENTDFSCQELENEKIIWSQHL